MKIRRCKPRSWSTRSASSRTDHDVLKGRQHAPLCRQLRLRPGLFSFLRAVFCSARRDPELGVTVSFTESLDGRALCISLAPELITAVVRSGKRVMAHSEVRIADGSHDSVLSALRTYLRQAGPTLRDVPVAISITTRWCRLSMLPWDDALRHEDSAARYGHAHFEAIYGDAARHLSICTTTQRPARRAWPLQSIASWSAPSRPSPAKMAIPVSTSHRCCRLPRARWRIQRTRPWR